MSSHRMKFLSCLGFSLARRRQRPSPPHGRSTRAPETPSSPRSPSTAPEAFIGSRSLSPTYNKVEVQALVEYGITNDLTAIFAPTFDHIQIGAPTNAERNWLGLHGSRRAPIIF